MAQLLREEDVRRLLSMDEALHAVEEAFHAMGRGEAVNVPRQRGALHDATINVLCAISTAHDAAGVKCYPVVRRDITVGSSFTMLVYRISTGALVGVLEANTLGQMRTGAASGIATKYLARPNSRVMALFGAGWQAESQVEAIARVLPQLERVNVVGRSPEKVRRFCRTMEERLSLSLVPCGDPERAVRQADVVTTVTGSNIPVFDGRWLQPGAHINAVGSNYATKRELDAITIQRAGQIVVDDLAVAQIECGDLLAPDTLANLDWGTVQPLCNVVTGIALGRTEPEEITLFESQGIGLEDLAVASRVIALALERGEGIEIPIR